MKLTKAFEFAYGNECKYCKEIRPSFYSTTLDFTKDVEGYGFAIRDDIDCDLSKVNGIIHHILPAGDLIGIVQFKTQQSNTTSEEAKVFISSENGIYYPVPNFTSPLKEIVFLFPKCLNQLTETINIVIYNIELF